MAWDDFKEPSTFQAQEGFYWARECFVFTCFSSIWTVGGSREKNPVLFILGLPGFVHQPPQLRLPPPTIGTLALPGLICISALAFCCTCSLQRNFLHNCLFFSHLVIPVLYWAGHETFVYGPLWVKWGIGGGPC